MLCQISTCISTCIFRDENDVVDKAINARTVSLAECKVSENSCRVSISTCHTDHYKLST